MDHEEKESASRRQDGATDGTAAAPRRAMTVSEAGRKGGITVRDERGHAFYEEIGRKGGQTVRNERGHEFYEEIGHKGGQKVKELIEAGKRRQAQQQQAPVPPERRGEGGGENK